jgi:inorganic pyrophosphatase
MSSGRRAADGGREWKGRKIVAVPVEQLNPYYAGIRTFDDLPKILRQQIAHFFRHYEDLEQGKWVKLERWAGPDEAAQLIRKAIERAH